MLRSQRRSAALFMCDSKQSFACPVCGYAGLDEAPYDELGCASYGICPCCGTQFGYDDASVAHADLREAWISNGMPWWSSRQIEASNNVWIFALPQP
jgi:transcription elongation factor Elf1